MPANLGSGRLAWFDVTTTDLSRSKEFYGQLFEWTFNPVQGTNLAVEIARTCRRGRRHDRAERHRASADRRVCAVRATTLCSLRAAKFHDVEPYFGMRTSS